MSRKRCHLARREIDEKGQEGVFKFPCLFKGEERAI